MRKDHLPTPELTLHATVAAFGADLEKVNSPSRRSEAVMPRETWVYLLRIRNKLTPEEISKVTGYPLRQVKRIIQQVAETITVSQDYSNRVIVAELLILQQTFKIDGQPAIKIVAASDKNNNSLFPNN